MKFEAGLRFLAQGGLNLAAVLDPAALPDSARQLMNDSNVPLDEYRRLVLLGHGGQRLWKALQAQGMETADPVDHYSAALTRRFIRDYLDDAPTHWLYPDTPYLIPLQQLGEWANWAHPSPLGLGISPVYGVWFAYRAAFLIDADLPLLRHSLAPSPCDSCLDKPCVTACPAGAVRMASFDVMGCARHRLRPESSCADRCLARMACPYFPEHRYTLTQIQYHYDHSLETLKELTALRR